MVRKIVHGLLPLGLVGMTLCSLAGYLGSGYWFLDLFAHFKVQYSIILTVLVFGLILIKKRKTALVAVLILVINLTGILPLYIASKAHTKEGTSISICSINLLSSNVSFGLVRDYIKEEDPDILILEELTTLWELSLDSILTNYPYQLSIARADNFGIGMYSKVKPDTIYNIIVNNALLPSILCSFSVGEDTIHLLGTHPLPPVGQFEFESRNNALQRIASLKNSLDGHFILIGDLNTSSFSTHFKELKKASGLIDTRKGFGVLNTWHADLPFIKVSLDHCLISEGLATIDRSVGPNIGSDHLPIFVEVGIKK